MFRIKDALLHDRALATKIIGKMKALLDDGGQQVRVMHVCGTHEHTIAEAGLRSILPSNVEVISGPGCPVCVCHTIDIYKAFLLANEENIVATFGDMMRVPSAQGSLQDLRARGKPVHVVYSIDDAISLARKNPGRNVVFFAVGFETFVPVVSNYIVNSGELPANFSFLISLKTITPVMELLLALGDIQINGFITPGHVSTIIGTRPYDVFVDSYRMPIVTAGFQPNDILLALLMIAKQLHDGIPRNENEYKGVVRREGNPAALELMDRALEKTTVTWRGIGPIPGGGYKIREEFAHVDANVIFDLDNRVKDEEGDKNKGIPPGCSCHKVIMGQMVPRECALFRDGRCNPQHPVGPCMVSNEGTCRIAFDYQPDDSGK